MGQTAVDLPDPLENPPPAGGAHADDLLSKLAGDEIDRLLAETTADPEVISAPQNTSLVPVISVPVAVEPSTASDLDAVLETAAAERTALHDLADHVAPVQVMEDDPAQTVRSSPLLKPLMWINAPVDSWSDPFRDIMGKIAVMTLVNAVAVLAYVFIFRRSH